MKNIIKKIKTYTKKLYVNTTCVLKIKTIKMKKKTVIFCLDSNRVGKMPAFMSKVHAGGIYRYLPAFTGIYRRLLEFTGVY